jgi:hypothetical protein
MSYPNECHEDVTRGGISQPCDRPAVGMRIDPEEGEPYPVCVGHVRHVMVPLARELPSPGEIAWAIRQAIGMPPAGQDFLDAEEAVLALLRGENE